MEHHSPSGQRDGDVVIGPGHPPGSEARHQEGEVRDVFCQRTGEAVPCRRRQRLDLLDTRCVTGGTHRLERVVERVSDVDPVYQQPEQDVDEPTDQSL